MATEALYRLDARLRARSSLTTTSAAGLAALRQRYADVPSALLPLDVAVAHRLRLALWRPRAAVLLEGDIWPSWLWTLRRRRVPLYWLNARVSERSFQRMYRVRWLLRPLLRETVAAIAQSEDDAARICALGVPEERVTHAPNLKLLGVTPRPDIEPTLPDGFAAWHDAAVPTLLFASVHPDEAEAIDAIVAALPSRLRIVLAPRHPERADDLLAALAPSLRESGRCFVVRQMGVLGGLYPRAVAVVVGGTFNQVGGHNPVEPAAAGVPVVIGPNFWTQTAGVELLRMADAIDICADAATAADAVNRVLADTAAARRRAEGGARAIGAVRTTIERAYRPIVEWIEMEGSRR